MGYVCTSDHPDYELVGIIRKTLLPGEYMLVINRANEIILCGLDTRNPKLAIWEWDFYEGERYVELLAAYSVKTMMLGETARNLLIERR